MPDPLAFCRAAMHEYEGQWARASGHGVRHPLRLKMQRLQSWCDETCTVADFEAHLIEAEQSDDIGTALLAEELLGWWTAATPSGGLPFSKT
ncbi:MAG: hypothetical protein LC797_04490 [Chloroflexi bacterium]|nr:hypothetical protein [Chloroflexota bacterium]